jgi:thiol:disulfide interchange protein
MQFTTAKIVPKDSSFSSSYEKEFSKLQFEELLRNNTGKIIVKFGATWCGPCKRIEAHVEQWFDYLTSSQDSEYQCFTVDVDESFDLYGTFKTRRQVSGIPAILYFKSGNVSYIPDDIVMGSDHEQVNAFFKRITANA